MTTVKIGAMLAAAGIAACAAPAWAGEIAVIVNPKNPATRMFAGQAAQFFLGKSTQFTPLDQADGSPIREEFCKKVLDKDSSQVKALWAKIAFTGKGVPPVEYRSSAEVKKAVAADPAAIGYIEKAAVDDTVKVVLSIQ